jgi:hypothetical protein
MTRMKVLSSALVCAAAATAAAQEPAWNAAAIKACDRACLVNILDRYLNAIYAHDPKAVPPLTKDVRMTENTGQLDVGEGLLWRAVLTEDVPAAQRVSREVMLRVANSYFDALEGDSGTIGAFADDCVRHENGYRTVNNPPPGGRMMPGPQLPDPNTEQGKSQLAFSMLTCAQQIDSKIFAYMKHIRPRRGLILDEQKQTVGTFPLFVHDGTRRGAPADAPPGMLQNLVTMETFSVRGGLIRHVEAAPFVTIPYGLGNGWTMNSGR